MKKIRFKTNINCSSCVRTVTPFLNDLDGLESWKVDTEDMDKILEVEVEEGDGSEVGDAVKKAGFTIEPISG
ncbi:MAG: heavy-metal-associated domain-containing protein [Sediminicola sp.]|tara:strand:- start:47671 stop:47886 length:216 start_codon:yes stop_codon:yes gene_type:complete